jgi:hypothetical protein
MPRWLPDWDWKWKWTTLEVNHGLDGRSVFDRAYRVWFSALTVGDNELPCHFRKTGGR